MSKYEPVIGLEIHAKMNTASKMFCFCSNDSFQSKPNVNVCPICMGFPGMLPAINIEAFKKGIISALALNCQINKDSKFDRKNYFYPDLPKGFQISQYDKPISANGYIDIDVNGNQKRIRINRLHLEDDAGKLTHIDSGTLCDYNRSGTPLMEIVSEADMFSVEEASVYAHEIRKILRYAGSSDCDMEKGNLRFDINISLRPKGEKKFGTKVEVKNLNSFKALECALKYEIERQEQVIGSGGKIVQETRGWDDVKSITVSQRSKEEADDYRYFPEPDLPPLVISEDEIDKLKLKIPELPLAKKVRFIESYNISEDDAEILIEEKEMADFFEKSVNASAGDPKTVTSFINTILLKYLKRDGIDISKCKITPQCLGKLIKLINEGVISNNMAKTEIIEAMYNTGEDPEDIVAKRGLKQMTDTSEIEKICKQILDSSPGPVEDYRKGKNQAFGFLVGKVMQETKGKANPKIVNELLKKLLEN